MKAIKSKLIAAFIAAGLSAPAAFVAYDLTLPSEGLVLLSSGSSNRLCWPHCPEMREIKSLLHRRRVHGNLCFGLEETS